MMATLRSFIALLLNRQWLEHDLTGKPGPTFPDHAQNLEFEGRMTPKKEARPKDRANLYSLQRNIVMNRRKTTGNLIASGKIHSHFQHFARCPVLPAQTT